MYNKRNEQGFSLYSLFFLWLGHKNNFPCWDTQYWCFGPTRKVFHSTIFLRIRVHPLNGMNIVSHNNLYYFHDWVTTRFSYWDTWYWYFGLRRQAFNSTIVLRIKLYISKEISMDSHNNLHFSWLGYKNTISSLAYKILSFGFVRKAFHSTIFLRIKVHSSSERNKDSLNNLYSLND